MKIKVVSVSRPHPMELRTCKVCGKKFIAYSKRKIICSKACAKQDNLNFHRDKKRRLKNDPEALYYYRKSTIDKREEARRAKIRADLPNIKEALSKGDEALVDYLLDHYGFRGGGREYRRPQK